MSDFQGELQRLSGSTLDAQACANIYAGTSGLELLGALNRKAGTSGLELDAVCNLIAGTSGLSAQAALARATSFTPTQVTGLLAWYDASVASSITAAAGRVSQWNDLSGTGNHIVQATAGNKPLTGTDTINSLNAIKFDKARPDFMQKAGVTIAQPLTMFAVVKGGVNPVQIVGNFTNPEATLWCNAGFWSLYAGTVKDSATAVDTNAHQLSAIFNGASSKLYVDTVDISPGNPGVAGRTTLTIGGDGGAAGWLGDIAEVLIYNSSFGSTDRLAAQAYLKAKWGTP